MEQPKRLTARLARYYRAIQEAKDGGYTWGEIRDALAQGGIIDKDMSVYALAAAFRRTRAAILDGRLAVQQSPLPARQQSPKAPQAPKQAARTGAKNVEGNGSFGSNFVNLDEV